MLKMPAAANQNLAADESSYYNGDSQCPIFSFRETEPSTPSSIADSMVYDLFGTGAPRSTWSSAPTKHLNNSYPSEAYYPESWMDGTQQPPTRPMTLPLASNIVPDEYQRDFNSSFCPQLIRGSPPYSSSDGSAGSSNMDMNIFGTNNYNNSPDYDNYNIVEYLNNIACKLPNGLTEQGLSNIRNLYRMNGINRITSFPGPCPNILMQSPITSPRNSAENINFDSAARYSRSAAVDEDDEDTDDDDDDEGDDAKLVWRGEIPHRSFRRNATYSTKVFLGGVPWDATEEVLIGCLSQFGPVKIEWPGKEIGSTNHPRGYVYVIFESENKVKELLDCCIHDYANGGSWYYKISSRRIRSKEVQVIPWAISDSTYSIIGIKKLDSSKTVFVGALHGMINAELLFKVMNDLFKGVISTAIDMDKNKYPIGSGRVTFNNKRSYKKAVAANYIEILTTKFSKKVQIDPYLEDNSCCSCVVQQGTYFCRDRTCLKYFCRKCWAYRHSRAGVCYNTHKPLMRNSSRNAALQNSNLHNLQNAMASRL